MSIADRAGLFGDPTPLLVAEAVWLFRRENGDWPLWPEAAEALMALAQCDEEEAERRILEALRCDEVQARLRAVRAWSLVLPDAAADAITRRYLDMTMPRADPKETW